MKQQLKKTPILISILIVALTLSCSGLFDSPSEVDDTTQQTENSEQNVNTEQTDDTKNGSIAKEYWGTWIRMDTGDEYYIDSSSIRKVIQRKNHGSASAVDYGSSIASTVKGYELDGDNVLKNGSIVYFRKGGKARDFSITVSGFSDSRARAISTGKQGISGRRNNKENTADNETATSDANGTVNFTGAVAGDVQTVTVDNTTSVEVTPQYNGENLGSVPIVEKGSYGFKTTYSIDADSDGYCFGNNYKTYTLKLELKNIGDADCGTSYYEISCDDTNLKFISGKKQGNFRTIEAGATKNLEFSVQYGTLKEEYVDVPINIAISDSTQGRTWEDSVTLRFHKELVNLKVNCHDIEAGAKGQLRGFIVYPDGRSKNFSVSTEKTEIVKIPYSTQDYYLAFSGASADSELGYSFGSYTADLEGDWSIADINKYEPNNGISTAEGISYLITPTKAYLSKGDIDFYKINFDGLNNNLDYAPVACIEQKICDNNDNIATIGEKLYLDVKMWTDSETSCSNVNVKLSSKSDYVYLYSSNATFTSMEAGKYYSLTDTSGADSSENCRLMNSTSDKNADKAFCFKILPDCPDTELFFDLTFNSESISWTDTVVIPVHSTQADIKVDEYSTKSENENENETGYSLAISGESYYLDVKAYNSGNRMARGVTVKLTTSSSFVTIERDSYTIGDMKALCYKSLTDTSDDNSSSYDCSLMNPSNYEKQAFKFSVASDCPDETKLPFTVTFTDSSGTTWTDNFEITAYTPTVNISLLSNSDYATKACENGNIEGHVATPGESYYLDVKAYNSGNRMARGVTVKLTTSSSFVTIERDSYTIGDMKAKYYYSLTDTPDDNSDSDDCSLMNPSNYENNAFKFSVASDCPDNMELTFTVTFKDSSNKYWTDNFTIKASKENAIITLASGKNYSTISLKAEVEGVDTYVYFLDIKAYNSGSITANDLIVDLTTSSKYVRLFDKRRTIGDMNAGCYKSLTDTSDDNSSSDDCSLMDSSNYRNNVYNVFSFSVDSSCPSGTELPFTVTFTDSSRNEWTDTLTIPVQ